ncbi:MAG TPA: M48 family metallopeptidase [Bryobacteraceae bacterium]|nr:M48 family metallopeptidase [Bryobacteraceae bacterium]
MTQFSRFSVAVALGIVLLPLCTPAPGATRAFGAHAVSTPKLPNPGDTGVSKEQQEQLGLQAMAEVYKQMPVLPDSSPESQFVQRLGKKLVAVIPPEASWPYQFHVIQQKEINAFALPGGPIFINVGTITAAANEAELAGVMAHEMSHIYMQHSIKQMKKQQTTQGVFGILGAVLGQGSGIASAVGRLGLGIGEGLLTLRYSRGDEAQADAVGAVIMYKADYNPVALAQFFEKLEQQGGSNGPNFLSDHPNPGNRVAAVEAEVRNWPPENYRTGNEAFLRVRQDATGVKAYSAQEIAQGAKQGLWAKLNQEKGSMPRNLPVAAQQSSSGALSNVSYAQVRPSGTFKEVRTNLLDISYPGNWQVSAADNGQGLTIAPAAGMTQGTVGYGVVVNSIDPRGASSLSDATNELVADLERSNPGLRANGGSQPIQVNGQQGRSVEMTGTSPVQQNGRPARERDWLVTLPAPQGGLVYLIFIAPENTFSQLRPTFQRILDSTRFH